jgi:hypothetical protein
MYLKFAFLIIFILYIYFFDSNQIIQFEDPTTPSSFAGTNTTFPAHTLKFTIAIQQWPFLALANSLLVVFDADASQSSAICTNPYQDDNLRWILLTVDKLVLYPHKLKEGKWRERKRDFI